jgi:hypothetical protein
MPLRSGSSDSRQLAPGHRALTAGARFSLTFLLLTLFCLGTLSLPGCGGCWKDTTSASAKKKAEEKKEEDEKKKKKKKSEKPKPDFEPLVMRMLPGTDPTLAVRNPEIKGKPGHWIAISVYAKANNYDFPGELRTFPALGGSNLPMNVENTTARVAVSRPASLPKGQMRPLTSLFYLPRREEGSTYALRAELRGSHGGAPQEIETVTSRSLRDYQHHMVVLASNPSSYSHLDKLHSVRVPDIEIRGETLQYYHVVRPNVEKSVPLPAWPLAWTTVAYIVWDDINPDVLTQDQQTALMDWLHWGGQLVISGPGSLDKLRGKKWIEPYLPAMAMETVKLEQAAFDELNAKFSLPERSKTGRPRTIEIIAERPMVGVNLKLHPAALPMEGTGGLVVERRVGGGRIVVTRFPLTDVRIKQWKNLDGFFNAALLRRPPRKFSLTADIAQFDMSWSGNGLDHMLVEPRLNSTLRYFSRDIGYATGGPILAPPAGTTAATGAASPAVPTGGLSGTPVISPPVYYGQPYGAYEDPYARTVVDTTTVHPELDDWHFLGYHASPLSGVAAWNDSGPASLAARQALTEAAGIEIPRADFVMKVLAIYLAVLVPLNWLIFWLMGRVEWAWIAAPVIAVVGAGAVIRLAQLDIGFARSRTEIAVLEVQGGYERAHLTRYTALYSSLSSTYTLGFEDDSALALPFPSGQRQFSPLEIVTYSDVAFRRDKGASLAGVKVISNSTGMVHSEMMHSLGDPTNVATETLTLVGDPAKGFTLKNSSRLTIRDVGIFRRVDNASEDGQPYQPRIETAFVAKVEPGTAAPLQFSPLPQLKADQGRLPRAMTAAEKEEAAGKSGARNYPLVWLPDWNQTPIFSAAGSGDPEAKNRIRLAELARLATDRLRLMPGDVRLVGWTDQPLGGMQIRPAAPQNKTYTLVVAHLVRGPLAAVAADVNVADDFLKPELDPALDPDAPMVEPGTETDGLPDTLQLNP